MLTGCVCSPGVCAHQECVLTRSVCQRGVYIHTYICICTSLGCIHVYQPMSVSVDSNSTIYSALLLVAMLLCVLFQVEFFLSCLVQASFYDLEQYKVQLSHVHIYLHMYICSYCVCMYVRMYAVVEIAFDIC